ncbi:MAG: VOC family protein [Clostridium butyricum]|nr:VOC family protein [Clostridium butyricum]
MKVIHHVCIQTEKYEESLNFYTNILGFKLIQETENFHSRKYNTWLKLGEFMIELQTNKESEKLKEYTSSSSGIVHMCFKVDDINDEYNKIKSLGYKNFKRKNNQEVYKVENGYLFKVIAPEGTQIEFRDSEI